MMRESPQANSGIVSREELGTRLPREGNGAGFRVRRVALVVTSLPSGGKERVVMNVAAEFRELGVEPLVVCLADKGALGERLESAGVEVIGLGSRRGEQRFEW